MNRLLFVCAIAIACTDATAPIDIVGLTPYDAPMLAWRWTEVEKCSGLTGDFSKVTFYTATSISYKGEPYRAIWRKADNAIIFAGGTQFAPVIIDHEEMHALLRGGDDHPAHYFVDGPCGNLMLP